MKRVTATWTVITHPFACLAEIANPFERVRSSHFHGVVLICDLTRRLSRGPHSYCGEGSEFSSLNLTGIRGGRSRADDGPSSALPGLFGGDRDPWRWQWVVTVKRLCPPCEFHGGAVKGWLDCAQYSHADCCRRNAQGGNKWVLVRKHQPKLVVCYPPLFPMKLTGILEHSH